MEPVSFKLRDPKDGTSQSIAYSELESVSKAGRGVSTKTWLIVGGIAAGAVTTFLIVNPRYVMVALNHAGSVRQYPVLRDVNDSNLTSPADQGKRGLSGIVVISSAPCVPVHHAMKYQQAK